MSAFYGSDKCFCVWCASKRLKKLKRYCDKNKFLKKIYYMNFFFNIFLFYKGHGIGVSGFNNRFASGRHISYNNYYNRFHGFRIVDRGFHYNGLGE